jgi:hypothetical protein
MKLIPIILAFTLPTVALAAENITIEAESFAKQTLAEKRRWEIKSELPDASGGA